MLRHKIYENGLTLIVAEGGALSASFAIMVGTGSVNESARQNGISHFIEHMNFKGTKNYSAYDISDVMESSGANFNAYTSAESTCYYAQTIVENLEKTFSIMSEAVFASVYLDEESEKEKSVIIEEINMSEDSPEDVCYDLLMRAYYGNDGYGRTILGPSKNVSSFTKDNVFKYLSDYYVAENVVISFSGNVTLEQADELVLKHVMPIIKGGAKKKTPKHNEKCLGENLIKIKDIEQAHLAIAFPSRSFSDEKRILSETAVAVLGGGMSSRLFRKVREELGLAYSVYSTSSRHKGEGNIIIYAGVNAEKYRRAYDAILEVIASLKKDGVTSSEIEKVKTQLKAATVYAQEKPQTLAQLYAKHYLMTGKLYDFDARIKAIDSITIDGVVNEYYSMDENAMATAVVGKEVKPLK